MRCLLGRRTTTKRRKGMSIIFDLVGRDGMGGCLSPFGKEGEEAD